MNRHQCDWNLIRSFLKNVSVILCVCVRGDVYVKMNLKKSQLTHRDGNVTGFPAGMSSQVKGGRMLSRS